MLSRYKALDNGTHVNVRRSIIELRNIYKELSDEAFVTFYHKRYRVKKEVILWVITQEAKQHAK